MAERVIVPCPECATRFSAPLDKFLPNGRQVRCSNCGNTWFHRPASLPHTVADRHAVEEPARYRAEPSEFRGEVVERTAPRQGGGLLGTLLWLLAAALLAAIIAYVFRPQLSQSFPSIAAPLERYGSWVDDTARGLLGRAGGAEAESLFRIEGTRYDVRDDEDGRAVLVEAMLVNGSDAEQDAPQLTVRLLDAGEQTLFRSEIGPEDASETLAGGARTRYFTRIPEPPEGVERVVVELPAGK